MNHHTVVHVLVIRVVGIYANANDVGSCDVGLRVGGI